MFSGLADTQAEMLKEIDDSKINATSVVTQAQQKAESMKAQQTEAMSAIAKIPAAVGGWVLYGWVEFIGSSFDRC